MMATTTEEEDEEIEDFLNTSERLLDLHNQGCDISISLQGLRLPRVRTPGVQFIYNELKQLYEKEMKELEDETTRRTPISEPSHPSSPLEIQHACKCVHVVLSKKNNDHLQAKDFAYLFIVAVLGLAIYLYLYSPGNYRREPIY